MIKKFQVLDERKHEGEVHAVDFRRRVHRRRDERSRRLL